MRTTTYGVAGSLLLAFTPVPQGIGHRDRSPHGPEFRSIDGTWNNREHPEWGRAGTALLRLVPPAYADGAGAPSGAERASPRAISNLVCAENNPPVPNKAGLSDFIWAWGQFLDEPVPETATAANAARPIRDVAG